MAIVRREVLAALAATVAVALGHAHAAGEAWRGYVNARFGTRIRYPQRFVAEPPPENGDGLSFVAADGARLTVFGHYNTLDETVEAMQQALTGPDYATITYRAGFAHGFVVSGYRDIDGVASIFYEKYALTRDGVVQTMILTYPRAARADYDPLVAPIARSFGPME